MYHLFTFAMSIAVLISALQMVRKSGGFFHLNLLEQAGITAISLVPPMTLYWNWAGLTFIWNLLNS